MEGLLILLLIVLPLTWTILLFVITSQNSNGFGELNKTLQELLKRLDRQSERLDKLNSDLNSLRSSSDMPSRTDHSLPADILPELGAPPPLPDQPLSEPQPLTEPDLPAPPYFESETPDEQSNDIHRPGFESAQSDQIYQAHTTTPAPEQSRPEMGGAVPPDAENSIAETPFEKILTAAEAETGTTAAAPVMPAHTSVPEAAAEPGKWRLLLRGAFDFLARDGHFWVAAGVLVLFLGASFLVRYTIALGWFTPAMRLMSTFVVGLALTAAGILVRHKRQSWALAVQGCGLGLMYLTLVGSVRVYDLLGQAPALSLMTVLVIVTSLLALWQNAQVVAHLGLAAAFAAPLLVSTGQNNYVGLFAFYTLINLGIIAMCLVRPWRRLYLTGFGLTFGIFSTWVAKWYQPWMFNDSVPFLVIFYLLYVFIGLSTASGDGLVSEESPKASRRFPKLRTDLTLTVLAPVLFLSLIASMAAKPYILSIAATAAGFLYLTVGLVLRNKYFPPLTARLIFWQSLICLNLGLAVFLFDYGSIWGPLHQWTIMSLTWSLEGALLCYTGSSRAKADSRVFGLISLGLSGLFTAFSLLLDFNSSITEAGSQFFVCAVVLGGACIHAAWSRLKFNQAPGSDFNWHPALLITGISVWAAAISLEWLRFYVEAEVSRLEFAWNWLLLAGSVFSLGLWCLARRVPLLLTVGRQNPENVPPPPLLVTAQSIVLIPVVIKAAAYLGRLFFTGNSAIYLSQPAMGIFAWAAVFTVQALAISQARAYRQARLRANIWGAALVVILANLLSVAALHFSRQILWQKYIMLLPVLAGLIIISWPPKKSVFKDRGFLKPLMMVLIFLAGCRYLAMIPDAASLTGFLPYLPLLNSADLLQAACCVLPLVALYKYADQYRLAWRKKIPYVLGAALFIWLNLILGRAVHHYANVSYGGGLFYSTYFQAASALVWGLAGIGTMITGHRAGRRTQWILGAALMALDLLKIFFIDLSNAGTVARIVSFVAVGLLLILVGYFAPLPPSSSEDDENDETANNVAHDEADFGA